MALFFPTILVDRGTDGETPINPDVQFREYYEDSTIRSKMESGTVITRKRFSRDRRTLEVQYSMLQDTEKQLIDQFVLDAAFQGTIPFQFQHPVTQNYLTVRFLETPQYEYDGMNGTQPSWTVSFKVQEV